MDNLILKTIPKEIYVVNTKLELSKQNRTKERVTAYYTYNGTDFK